MKRVIIDRIYEEIKKKGSEGATAKELAKSSNFCMATVYKAVKELLMEGRIRENVQGKTSIFIANPEKNVKNLQNIQNIQNTQPQTIADGL